MKKIPSNSFISSLFSPLKRATSFVRQNLSFTREIVPDVQIQREGELIELPKQSAFIKSHRHGSLKDEEWLKSLVKPRSSIINVMNIPTHVYTWKGEATDPTLLMISGNPGLPGFYKHFCSTIHRQLDGRLNIVLVGHVGHSTIIKAPSWFRHTLPEQVSHKKELWRMVQEWFPESRGYYIAGHSIGAWTALQCLKNSSDKIKGAFMLFPVLEDILNTPNGLNQHKMFRFPFRNMLAGVVGGLAALSSREGLIQLVERVSNQPRWSAEIVAGELLGYSSLLSVFTMSQDEMLMVKDLHVDLIKPNLSKLIFYYGQTDDWAPLSRYHSLMKQFPDAKAFVDDQGIPHAFVLSEHHAEIIAEKVAEWIQG